MSTMIDKLTRTVQESAADGNDSPVDYGDAQGIVRDVLTALLEPTEAMLQAMKTHNDGVTNINENWDDCHRRMLVALVNAALQEGLKSDHND